MRIVTQLKLWAAALLLALSGTAAESQAGWPYCVPYNVYGQDYIPYFARHPPVYYSYPVPRTYGYSPFAYPPTVMTPEISIEAPAPKVMSNPFVPKAKADQRSVSTAPAPQFVINPYFDGPAANPVAQTK